MNEMELHSTLSSFGTSNKHERKSRPEVSDSSFHLSGSGACCQGCVWVHTIPHRSRHRIRIRGAVAAAGAAVAARLAPASATRHRTPCLRPDTPGASGASPPGPSTRSPVLLTHLNLGTVQCTQFDVDATATGARTCTGAFIIKVVHYIPLQLQFLTRCKAGSGWVRPVRLTVSPAEKLAVATV